MTKSTKYKFPKPCDKQMTFQDCELTILRQAVDDSDLNKKKKLQIVRMLKK
tara:strand:- start:13 stop:165 length:153 start_codon:yes stop_codon:yes gene_type:complete